jgi:hypothetical protein
MFSLCIIIVEIVRGDSFVFVVKVWWSLWSDILVLIRQLCRVKDSRSQLFGEVCRKCSLTSKTPRPRQAKVLKVI